MSAERTVFISYRRTNSDTARLVYYMLKSEGYDVFLDTENIDAGAFGQIILNQIAARAHFVIILTPSALERCVNPDDWMRREIEYAIEKRRNIIPLVFDGFRFEDAQQYLPPSLQMLTSYNALPIHRDYFEEGIERLKNRYLSKPLDVILHPAPAADQRMVEQTIKQADEAPAVVPEHLQAERYFEEGVQLRSEGRNWEAIDKFSEAIRLKPDFAEAYHLRGDAYAYTRATEKSIEDYQKALQLAPDSSRVNVIRSKYILAADLDYTRALAEAEEGVRRNPYDSEAFFQRGTCHTGLGNYQAALPDYEKAVTLTPTAALYVARAGGYIDMNQFELAIKDCDAAIGINASFGDAYVRRSEAHQRLGELDQALHDINQAIGIENRYPDVYVFRASIRMGKGEIQEAIADCNHALQLSPDYAFAYAIRANLYSSLKNFDQALADAQKAVQLEPRSAYCYDILGGVYADRGDYQNSILAYAQAIRIAPLPVY